MTISMTSPNIISSCSRLNEDVLREIFVRCAEPFYLDPCFLGKRSIRPYPQLSVSRVCSLWRHVALLTPQLWNNIYIYDLTEANLSIASQYLSRARSLCISITFNNGPEVGYEWHSLLAEFLSSYRLRRLHVYGNNPHIYFILPDLPQRSVADLEELWLIINYRLDDGLSIELNDIRYPTLTVVDCRCKVSGYSSILRVFDYLGVGMTVTEGWDLLSHFPSLEKCRFMLKEEHNSPGPVSVPQILLHNLRTLQVESEGDDMPFSTFLEALALPNLEDLVVTSASRVVWSTTAFQSFAQRSNHFPNLRAFVLRDPGSDVDAGSLLALMPSITSMHLFSYRYPTNHQAIFDRLALNDLATGSLAPRLRVLEVGYISNVEEFMGMVKSRSENAQMSSDGVPAPFTRVRFRGRERDDVISRVQIFRYP